MSAHVAVSAAFSCAELNTQIVLKTCSEADIDDVVHYFENEKPELFEVVGVDLRYLPAVEEVREDLAALCAELDRAKSLAEFVGSSDARVPLVFSLRERLIGHLVITRERDHLTGATAWFAHSHIWSESDRSQGIGSVVFSLMLKLIREHLPIPKLILEMSAENVPMVRLLARALDDGMNSDSKAMREFKRIPDYNRPAHGITRAMRVARFEIEF